MLPPLTHSSKLQFRKIVTDYYQAHGRHQLAWRQPASGGMFDPYAIMVSEIMLQQTQVNRVAIKYEQFLSRFPTVESLAEAPLSEVLKVWSGLGYNRRAKYIHETARQVQELHGGIFPDTTQALVRLPGIGKNTAAAIVAYSFNKPVVFIETNIRTVYLHHFFTGRSLVADADLMPLIESTLDTVNPRQWYWALMDYGTFLKSSVPNPSRASKHHIKQSTFNGSKRQIRGKVLRELLSSPLPEADLQQRIQDDRLRQVLEDLFKEGLITKIAGKYSLGK